MSLDSGVRSLPAFDRVQTREDSAAPTGGAWRPVALAALVLVGIAATAWWIWPDEESANDVLVHFVETADTFRPDLGTTRPDEARAAVLDALGWDVMPPDLPALAIVGVGIPTIGAVQPSSAIEPVAVQVPTFRYEGTDGERAVVFAYDYILLDRVRQSFDLPDGTYAGLSEPSPVDSRVVQGQFAVTWRRRSMIFTAITPDEDVAERIRQAVAS